MRYRFKPWQFAVLLVLVCIAAILGAYFYRASGLRTSAQMASYLPLGDGALVYVDVDALRRSGLLDLIAGKKATEEIEYQSFVDETRFDYREDLDAAEALFRPGQVFMVLRGRFHWKNLIDYVNHHGGSCANSFCTVVGSTPERRVSFYPIRTDVMALAVSQDSWAAYQITRRSGRLPIDTPPSPAWAVLSGSALGNFSNLPAGTKSFATALEGADQMVFTVEPKDSRLQLTVNVTCGTSDKAVTLLNDLTSSTDTLRRWLEREHQQPNPADLSGILTAGNFRRDERHVYGVWPVPRTFIEAVAGGANQ